MGLVKGGSRMWGKVAFAVVFWVGSIVGVTQLVQALPLSPGGSDNLHDPYKMIFLGSALLLLAIFNGKFFKK